MDIKSEWQRPVATQFDAPQQAPAYVWLNDIREQFHKLAPLLRHAEAHEPGRGRGGRRAHA
jgi:hypothetical protein